MFCRIRPARSDQDGTKVIVPGLIPGQITVHSGVRNLESLDTMSILSQETVTSRYSRLSRRSVSDTVHLNPDVNGISFQMDEVFGPATTQEKLFEDIEPLITSFIDGTDVCVFAYGQTGAGKTHTLQGKVYKLLSR